LEREIVKGLQKTLTYEDLNEVLLQTYADLKQEVLSGKYDSSTTDTMAVSMITLAFMGVRLNQRVEKSEKASNEFSYYLNKISKEMKGD
jgi:hypothetical protein